MSFEQDSALSELSGYHIVDSEPEATYDDIVLLARLICDAPIATVTFLEEHRQWFKAAAGLDICESPIAESICALAVQQGDLFVIRDLLEDRRTRDMSIATCEPFVRFYAGAPITTPNGHRVGTICVMDTKPRPEGLTLSQGLSMEALSRQVAVNLQLRKASLRSA
jgi:GAF domain-containing protein